MQIHGSLPYKEIEALGYHWSEILDFSANVNPYPLPFEIPWQAIQNKLRHYPGQEHRLKQCLSDHLGISLDSLLLLAGSTELIYALARLYPQGLHFSPSYGDYAQAHLRAGGSLASVDWDLPHADKLIQLQQSQAQILWICQPNNPTGHHLSQNEIGEILAHFSGMVVLDEAYLEMSTWNESAIAHCQDVERLIVLKSWTKPYALAGLRVSYATAHPSMVPHLQKQLMPWGINSIAEEIIPMIYQHIPEFESHWQHILESKAQLIQECQGLGFSVQSGIAPYFLLDVPHAEALRQAALKSKIALRNCASFGLPGQVRIMPQIPDHNRELIHFLEQFRP